MQVRRSIAWIDQAGKEQLTTLTAGTTAHFSFLDLPPLSNADWSNWQEGTITTPAFGAPASADYPSVGQTCAISGIDAIGTSNRFMLPAPIKGLFTSDENTVDTLNPLFFTLNAQAAFTIGVPQSSLPVIQLLAGWLFRQAQGIRETYLVNNLHPTRRVSVLWRDATAKATYTHYIGVAPMTAFLTALSVMSNAIVAQAWEGPLTINPTPTPGPGIYGSVNDLAHLIYADRNGNRTFIRIPAPKEALFLADHKTVDPAYAGITNLTTDAIAELVVPASGLPVRQFLGGYLVRTRAEGLA